MAYSDRIKACRNALKLSQTAFGERIGVSRDAINNVENGRAEISEILLRSVCREFSVNELWLREGVGEMFVALSREDKILEYVAGLVKSKDAEFQRWIISLFADLPPETWSVIEQKVRELLEAQKKETE